MDAFDFQARSTAVDVVLRQVEDFNRHADQSPWVLSTADVVERAQPIYEFLITGYQPKDVEPYLHLSFDVQVGA